MLNLNYVSQDLNPLNNNFSKPKALAKEDNKDFSQILEEKTTIIKDEKPKEITQINAKDTKERSILKDKEVKSSKKEDKPEEIEKDLETLINFIYSIVFQIDMETEELEDLNLDALNLELEELSIMVKDLLENNLSSTNQGLEESLGELEKLILTLDKELIKLSETSKEKLIDIPIDEMSTKLDELKNNIKEILENDSSLMKENFMDSKDEKNLANINKLEGEDLGFEEAYHKEKTINFHENIEENQVSDNFEEDIEVIDKNNPIFEIVDRTVREEIVSIENKVFEEVDKKEIIEQITDKIKLIIEDNKQEIRIKLKPEILGELSLKMEVTKDGLLAKIMVDNHRTKELIETNLYLLKEDMKENGLEIKAFEVFVGTNEDFERENRQKFNFNKKSKKIKIKKESLSEIKVYDKNIGERASTIYNEGQLNLFA